MNGYALNVRVDSDVAAKIDQVAEDEQRSRSNAVRRLLSEALAQRDVPASVAFEQALQAEAGRAVAADG